VALQTQADSAVGDLKSERQKLETLKGKLKDYEERLFQTPVVERDYKSLSRDYENAQAKYAELTKKQSEAKLAQQLESGKNAERFVLSNPPNLPTSPESPNRVGLFLLGGLLAFAAGIGGCRDRRVSGQDNSRCGHDHRHPGCAAARGDPPDACRLSRPTYVEVVGGTAVWIT
jgi:uncharacterized protein involved in exopolysaccharide biosynthesis